MENSWIIASRHAVAGAARRPINETGSPVILRFGDCRIDTERRELRRGGLLVPTEPQVYDLLLLLIEQRHRVVSRDELLDTLWKGKVVSDAAVGSRIKAARAAIGDDGKSQQCIRTLHRTGFRFVADVECSGPAPLAPATGTREDVQRILSSAETLDNIDLSLPSQTSVAILPLQVACPDPSTQLLADGLAHDLIASVARTGWLFVASRGSTFHFRMGPYDAREIGRALGVHFVVQGRVQRDGDQVLVQLSLGSARDNSEVWGDAIRRRLDGLLDVQQELADTISAVLESRIESAERRRALLRPPASLDAWENYHRGCWHMYRFNAADHNMAEQFFRRSIELDPLSPRAHAGLSFVHWQRAFLEEVPDRDSQARLALESARYSLDLNPHDPQGHWAVGRAHLLFGEVAQAVEELQASVELNPSSAMAQYSLAFALMQLGTPERAIEVVGRARRLSPYDPMTFAMFAVRAQNLAFLGDYEQAAILSERAASRPNAHYQIAAIGAYCNVLAGREEIAAALYRKLKAARPDYGHADFLRAYRLVRPEHIELTREGLRRLESLRV